ncbi:MAG: hypothetical protein AAFU85_14925 [Planctomycetota bacterium]
MAARRQGGFASVVVHAAIESRCGAATIAGFDEHLVATVQAVFRAENMV